MNMKWKDLRKQYQLSQEQMAALAGVHRTTWGAYERGERTPPLRIYENLAHHLAIPLADLLKEESPEPTVASPEETAIIHAFRNLDSEGKEYILREMVREEDIARYYKRRSPLG